MRRVAVKVAGSGSSNTKGAPAASQREYPEEFQESRQDPFVDQRENAHDHLGMMTMGLGGATTTLSALTMGPISGAALPSVHPGVLIPADNQGQQGDVLDSIQMDAATSQAAVKQEANGES
jgi:hypothetical protein